MYCTYSNRTIHKTHRAIIMPRDWEAGTCPSSFWPPWPCRPSPASSSCTSSAGRAASPRRGPRRARPSSCPRRWRPSGPWRPAGRCCSREGCWSWRSSCCGRPASPSGQCLPTSLRPEKLARQQTVTMAELDGARARGTGFAEKSVGGIFRGLGCVVLHHAVTKSLGTAIYRVRQQEPDSI